MAERVEDEAHAQLAGVLGEPADDRQEEVVVVLRGPHLRALQRDLAGAARAAVLAFTRRSLDIRSDPTAYVIKTRRLIWPLFSQ